MRHPGPEGLGVVVAQYLAAIAASEVQKSSDGSLGALGYGRVHANLVTAALQNIRQFP